MSAPSAAARQIRLSAIPTATLARAVMVGILKSHQLQDISLRSNLMHIFEDAPWDTNDEHLQVSPCPVLDSARHVDHDTFAHFYFGVVQGHPALPAKDIVDLVRFLVIVQLGIRNLKMMHLGG